MLFLRDSPVVGTLSSILYDPKTRASVEKHHNITRTPETCIFQQLLHELDWFPLHILSHFTIGTAGKYCHP